jgi:hypothetical protein
MACKCWSGADSVFALCLQGCTKITITFLCSWVLALWVEEVGWQDFDTPSRFHPHRLSETNVFFSLDLCRWNRPGVPKRLQPLSSTHRVKPQESENVTVLIVTQMAEKAVVEQGRPWESWVQATWFLQANDVPVYIRSICHGKNKIASGRYFVEISDSNLRMSREYADSPNVQYCQMYSIFCTCHGEIRGVIVVQF